MGAQEHKQGAQVVLVAAAGVRAGDRRGRVEADMLAAGLRVCSAAEKLEHGGVVLFERADAAALTLVRELSAEGCRRVVAVGLAEEALAGSAPWDLLAAGAADALCWSGASTARELLARFVRWREVDELLASPLVRENLLGEDPAWVATLRALVEVACFSGASVLITGESGTGKELVARLIHALDRRAPKGELVVVDCTTVVPTLSGSEFFGHERGAFTGAVAAREGAFALADGGTLFLDEVGELPLTLQAELLRVVQEGVYKPVGSNRWRETNFRLVCATNRDLRAEEARGSFRRDFYYRIAAWACRLPSLRERRGDVLVLAGHFLAQLLPESTPQLDGALRDYLLEREYPGNIRDLRQLVVRLSHHHVGDGPITVGALPLDERPAPAASSPAPAAGSPAPVAGPLPIHGGGEAAVPAIDFDAAIHHALAHGARLKDLLGSTRETAVRLALEAESGNVRRASRRLGITDRAIHLQRAAQRAAAPTDPDEGAPLA
jgi:transcriptional regulator with GAF, ATPase, and Fis domain